MIKKFIKWTLFSLLILLAGLLIAYWSAPYWVPSQLQQFLPQTLKLDQVEIERPGLSSAKIPKLSFIINGESSILVELYQVELNYSIWRKKLNSIKAKKATIAISSSGKVNNSFNNQIQIPKIPVENLQISQLRLSGLLVQDILINDLNIRNQNSNIFTKGAISFFGINFETDLKLYTKSQLLNKVTANIEFLGDQISASISPSNDKGFYWNINANLNNQALLPVDGIKPISILGAGYFTKDEHLFIRLAPDFKIQTEVDLGALSIQEQLEPLLKQQNIAVNLSNLQSAAKISINTAQALDLKINNDNQISLEQGALPLSISHPLLSLNLLLNQFNLDANQSLSNSNQTFAGNLSLETSLQDFLYQDQSIVLSSPKVDFKLATDFSIKDALLTARSKSLNASLASSKLTISDLKTKLPSTEWHGTVSMRQSLLGNPEPDYLLVNLKQQKPINLQLNTAQVIISIKGLSNRLTLENDQLEAFTQAKQMQLKQQPLTANNLSTTSKINLSNKTVKGSGTVQSLNFSNDQANLADFATNFDWSLLKNTFVAQGKIRQADLSLPFNYRLDLKNNLHQLSNSKSDIPVTSVADWFDPILAEFPKLQLIDGTLTTSNIVLDPISLSASGEATISDLNLLYDELSINNLNFSDTFSDRAPLTGNANLSIESIELASGISINDFSTELNHRQQLYRFKDIHANLLDGSLNIKKLTISPKLITPFTVELNAVNFTPLLEAFESESLFIDGKFDFILPIHINDTGQAIKDGTFTSIAAGILKVKTAEAADTNIAFQALDNFHYSNLSGTINYSEDGIYRLKVNLAGNNPNLYDGFPIELTLNIEGNLPNLLHSMVFSGDMAKPIIDKYHSGDFDLPDSPEVQTDN